MTARLSAEWLDSKEINALFGLFAEAGHQLLLVGGCVRDALLGRPARDIDLATDASPKDTIDLACSKDWQIATAGFCFGTVEVLVRTRNFSITTFRKDILTDGRRPVVEFGTRLEEDARRRDFAINAIYADLDGNLHDPVDGLGDIARRVVKFIGCPDQRIREDYLRAIRMFRIGAMLSPLGFEIDPGGQRAVRRCDAEGLRRLSGFRVRNELELILSERLPAKTLEAMLSAGVLDVLMEGARVDRMTELERLEVETGIQPEFLRRLALLGGPEVSGNLELTRSEALRLKLLDAQWRTPASIDSIAYRHGAGVAVSVALLRSAIAGVAVPSSLFDRCEHAARQRFPVRASDLQPERSGRQLGNALDALESKWIESAFSASRKELLERLEGG
ncbi:MAG: CCA tRNA nucleotidyltransferase [Rhodobacteraceae bacterium]|nr:CCA tRNA nucleotidyltransferase [Paracoccaceae bacterium]